METRQILEILHNKISNSLSNPITAITDGMTVGATAGFIGGTLLKIANRQVPGETVTSSIIKGASLGACCIFTTPLALIDKTYQDPFDSGLAITLTSYFFKMMIPLMAYQELGTKLKDTDFTDMFIGLSILGVAKLTDMSLDALNSHDVETNPERDFRI